MGIRFDTLSREHPHVNLDVKIFRFTQKKFA